VFKYAKAETRFLINDKWRTGRGAVELIGEEKNDLITILASMTIVCGRSTL